MAKTIKLIYWFVHNDNSGNIYEDEKGNWVVVFDGVLKIGSPFHVMDTNHNQVDPEEIGLIQLLQNFIVARPQVGEHE